MAELLKVLIVEDSEDDALLLVRELKKGGYSVRYQRVDSADEMNLALDAGQWDAVISDFVMPQFSGLDALALMQARKLDLPFIMVSGKIGEDTAVESMRAGAHDFVTKQNLARLVPAIERELGEAENRRRRRLAEEALRETQARYQTIVETALEGIVLLDREGKITYANKHMAEMLEYEVEELMGRPIFALVHPDEKADAQMHWEKRKEGFRGHMEIRLLAKDDSERAAIISATPFFKEDGDFIGLIGMFTDITERRLLEEHKREFFRKTLQAATQGKLVICEREEISRICEKEVRTWDLDSPEDVSTIRRAVSKAAMDKGMDSERAYDFELCAGEALTNAYKHAGTGRAGLCNRNGPLLFTVKDDGPGIEALNLPEVALKMGYTTAASLGMGYTTMLSVADRVYLATGPEGTTVAIEMGLRSPELTPIIEEYADMGWKK